MIVRPVLRRECRWAVATVLVTGLVLGAKAAAQVKPTFLDFTTTTTQGIKEHGAHGIAFADVDNDGDLDVFVSNLTSLERSTLPDELYINRGGLHFTEESVLRGITATEGEAHAAVFADVNGDGFVDLFKGDTNGTNELYINDQHGFFKLTTKAGIKSTINPGSNYGTRGVGAGDFDGDGFIDLFAANSGQSNELYINRGDGTFREEAVLRGADDQSGNNAQTQGCAIADYDGDGDLDIFLAKRDGPNRLLRNDGAGFFTDVAKAAGVEMATIDCDGGVFGDIDNDGDLDLFVAKTSAELHGAFRNRGDGTFVDESNAHKFSNGRAYNILLEDVDVDGDLDVVITFNSREAHRTYLNDGKGQFSQVKGLGYEIVGKDQRCAGFADLDGDGDRDFVVVDRNTHNVFFENRGMGATVRHWLAVEVKGPNGQPSMPGAWVEVYPAGHGGKTPQRLRVAHVGGAGEGYCRADHNVAWFGLPEGSYDVQARLPSGEVVRATNVGVDQVITLDPTPPKPIVAPTCPLGVPTPVVIHHPADPFVPYWIIASLVPGSTPFHPADRRRIPLVPDLLFQWSLFNLGNYGPFRDFMGFLSPIGVGWGWVTAPRAPALAGLTVHFAFVTLDGTFPNGVRTISRASSIRFTYP